MAATFRILPGQSFVMHDGAVKHGGELIELDDDVAALNRHRVEPVAAEGDAPAGTGSADADGTD